ncbi:hypothetical protein AB0M57_19400 [Streptomyces sp. NPDC051597]|uniref:hypothetical protein n=1 Tax=Streptomyces sp. NPDC051597 TaxID=3155049 RepID=UPI00341442FF
MAAMRRGFKRFGGFGMPRGFGGVSAGGGALLVAAVCGLSLSAGVAHGGVAQGGVGDPVARPGAGVAPTGPRVAAGSGVATGSVAARATPGSSAPGGAAGSTSSPGSAGSAGSAAPAALDPGAVAPVASGAEADISYHGHISLWSGRVGVWVEPSNHGPTAVPDATLRLRFSSPLAGAEPLPPGCLRGSTETVLCSTGAMRAAGAGRPIALDLRIAGSPAEVVVNINTSWSGGVGDRNPGNNTHRVLAPATGDKYAY